MKVWMGYASEHSMNLVMIGRFKEVHAAAEAMQAIERLTEQVNREVERGGRIIGEPIARYSDDMLKLLRDLALHSIGPDELEQLVYDVNVTQNNELVLVKTDEIEVSAFLKVLLDKGARVEVYSAHDYPEAPG